MKKTRFIVTLILIVFLIGCSNDKEEEQEKVLTPYDYLNEYITLWEQYDFQTMYNDYLLDRIKAKYSYEDFGERYEFLYDVLEVDNLTIEIIEETEIDEDELEYLTEYDIPIRISFDTLAGPIDYQNNVKMFKEIEDVVIDEDENEKAESKWLIEWDHSFILPRLQDGDEVRITTIPGARGDIVDRNGNLLATNGEVYEVGVTLQSFDESRLSELADILNVTEDFIRAKYSQSWVQENHFVPIKKILLEDEQIVSRAVSIDGVTSRIVHERIYPYKEIVAHLVGYIGAINQEELEALEDEGYDEWDRIGKRGLEQLYERELRGVDGVEIYILRENQSTQTIVRKEPENGETIQLTIDIDLQQKLYDIVEGERGTAVTINPLTGEVTALISTPAFNPNDFILGMTNEQYNDFINDENQPNINRFAATYSPGSTIKLISSIVGFDSGVLNPDELRSITGKRWQPNDSWGNYQVTRVYDNYGEVNLERAITFSDNIYFAMLSLDVGPEQFKLGLEKLGFGESIPFKYPVSTSQISNSGDFQSEILLADTSYGQGELLINIVHLATLYGGIVNDGDVMKPLLLTNENEEVWLENIISEEEAGLLQQHLRNVVVEGTGRNLNINGRNMAAKTGTAELKSSFEDEDGVQNGLIVTYDQNKPDLLLAMLIEGIEQQGGSGYVVEKARELFE